MLQEPLTHWWHQSGSECRQKRHTSLRVSEVSREESVSTILYQKQTDRGSGPSAPETWLWRQFMGSEDVRGINQPRLSRSMAGFLGVFFSGHLRVQFHFLCSLLLIGFCQMSSFLCAWFLSVLFFVCFAFLLRSLAEFPWQICAKNVVDPPLMSKKINK